jgi:twinkle protein
VFPYFKGDKAVNVKYRFEKPDGDKEMWQAPHCESVVYGYNDIKGQEVIHITEGEVDALSLNEVGIINVMSLPIGGINANDKNIEGKLKSLKEIEGDLQKAKKIILVTDNDEVGIRTRDELERRIGKYKCFRVSYPGGCKDANDVLRLHGKDALSECINNAFAVPVDGLIKLKSLDMLDRLSNLYTTGFRKPETIGIKAIDEKFRCRPGELTVVTGIPSHGKSLFVDFMTMNLAKRAGWHIGVFSPEHYPVERYYARMMQMYSGKPLVPGYGQQMDAAMLKAAIDFVHEHFVLMGHARAGMTIDNVLELAKIAVFREGIKALIIDPWNRFEHNTGGVNEAHYVAQTLDKIDWFGRTYDVHTFLVAHPRLIQKNRRGEYPKPTLYDISGGANFRNFVYNGLIVWRDIEAKVNITEIEVQKIKFEECGEFGTIYIGYDNYSRSYYDLPQHAIENYIAKKKKSDHIGEITGGKRTNGKYKKSAVDDAVERKEIVYGRTEKEFGRTDGDPF